MNRTKLSRDSIKEYLKSHTAAEFEKDRIDYYLHVTNDKEIVEDRFKADQTFIYHLTPADYGMSQKEYEAAENPETIYSHEVDGDPIFERIVDNLLDQVNQYFAVRLIDATQAEFAILKKSDKLYDEGEHILSGAVMGIGGLIHNQPTINLEDLPLVQELRKQLAKVTAERDAAVSDIESVMAYDPNFPDTCQFCKNVQCQARGGTKPCLPKWRGIEEVQKGE